MRLMATSEFTYGVLTPVGEGDAGAREVATCGYCFHSDDAVRTSGGGGVCRDMDKCAANERADYEAMLSDKETS